MAKIGLQMPCLYHYPYLTTALFAPFIILAAGPQFVKAQLQQPATDASPSQAAPTLIFDPTDGDTFSAASSASAFPSSTDSAGYASHNNDNRSSDTGVLNYYFLLLAVFVIVIAVVWWSIARRRRNRVTHLRNNQQSVLARDLETWPGRRGGAGRWRFGGAEPRAEDGLDERGEAPPPYLKEPDPVHHTDGPGMELHDLTRGEGKPPDYDGGSARR